MNTLRDEKPSCPELIKQEEEMFKGFLDKPKNQRVDDERQFEESENKTSFFLFTYTHPLVVRDGTRSRSTLFTIFNKLSQVTNNGSCSS